MSTSILEALPVKLDIKHTQLVFYIQQHIYSNKKETSDFHGTVSFNPVKMLQLKSNQNVYQTSDTQNNGKYLILSSDLKELLNLKCTEPFFNIIRKFIIKT